MTILCIAEKMSLAEAAGKVLADMKGVKPEFDWGDSSKARQYNQVGDVKFVWLDGHAFEQAMPDYYLPDDVPMNKAGTAKIWREQDLPVIPPKWEIFPKAPKKRRLDMIEAELKTCSLVWHMGDPDEEGQVLVDECLHYYGYQGVVKRILINDYNTSKVKAALENIRDNSEPMFRAWYMWGLARSHYDWLLGLNATRAMTLRGRSLGFDGVLPVGSVQTPLLYIVRERDRLIEDFKPIPYFTISARLKHQNGSFKANWKAKEDQPGLDPEGRLIDAAIAKGLVDRLTGKPALITAYSNTKKQQKTPLPLSMNELQMDGFSKYGYSGQQVLDAGQMLYETYKVMTYPRSDNRYLSEAKHAEAPEIIETIFKLRPDLNGLMAEIDLSRKSDAFNDKKMEGTPHHGIIPTVPEIDVDMSKWTEIERNIYEMVVRSYLAQFAAPYEYMQTSIEADIDGEIFSSNGRTPVSQGWKAIYAEVEDDDKQDDDADDSAKQTLPVLNKGDSAMCEGCDQASKKTKAPARFDDKMLIDCMMNIHKYVTDEAARKRLKEGDGIGTTATRAPMIQDMKDRELFVLVKEGSAKIKTSTAARGLIDALPLDVKDPAQAGVFKSSLDNVAKADDPAAAYEAFLQQTIEWVTSIVVKAKSLSMALPSSGEECPKCALGRLKSKNGKNGVFWFCTRWNADPKCDATFPDKNGKPDKTPAVKIECPSCKTGSLRRKTNDKGAWWYCSNWNAETACQAKFQDAAGKPDLTPPLDVDCPTCKQGKLRRKTNDKGSFWYCTRWNADPKCAAKFQDDSGKPDFEGKIAAAKASKPSAGSGGFKVKLAIPGTKPKNKKV